MPLINLGISNHTLWIAEGGRGLDTAFVYGDDAQKETGEAVRASSLPRSELFVTTKVPCCPAKRWESFVGGEGICDQLGSNTSAQIEHDLNTLGLEYVDLMLLHWPCDSLEETLQTYRVMESMVSRGTARAIGISNFNATMTEALVREANVKPVINQCGFSIGGHTSPEWGRDDATVSTCKRLGIHFEAYSPLGGWARNGTGHILDDPTVKAIATSHKKSAAQVALKWLLQQDIIVVTASNEKAYDDSDLDLWDFMLTSEEQERLSAL